jgi:Arc/MetJ-type ribon-helix-helix transcriptional regulator
MEPRQTHGDGEEKRPEEMGSSQVETGGTPARAAEAREVREARIPVAELSRESAQFLASLGRTIRESINQALEGRANVVMVRVNDETLRAIDELVQAGLFKTRSEAAAFLLHEGMKARRDVLDSISETARRIEELRQQLRARLQGEVLTMPATGEGHSPAPEAHT